jgi:hypothetical protein
MRYVLFKIIVTSVYSPLTNRKLANDFSRRPILRIFSTNIYSFDGESCIATDSKLVEMEKKTSPSVALNISPSVSSVRLDLKPRLSLILGNDLVTHSTHRPYIDISNDLL